MTERIGYATEEDVYEATGLNATVVKNLSGKQLKEVTDMINNYIARADKRIKRELGIPITVRKEYHLMEYNDTIELGPQEDEFEFYGNDDPANCIENVFAIYLSGGRMKLPYPKNCDDLTEDVDDMTATSVTLSKETSTVKCGNASVKAIFLAGGSFYFPSDANLNKNIEPWEYIGFWFQTSDKTSTFTLKLYDKDGNVMTQTFTLNLNDTWEIVALRLDAFSGDIDWATTNLQKVELVSSKACTCYFDNFNFNSLLFWTQPEGLICWCDPSSTPYCNFHVTYSYDPFRVKVPDDVRWASAKLAGVKLLDYCIGARIRIHGFKHMAHDFEQIPDKNTLEVTRGRLIAEARRALAGIGYKTYEGFGGI